MNSYFADLGREVLAQWKAANFSLPAFSEIAMAALDEQPPVEHVDVEALIRDFLLNDEQPSQTLSGFGQPELVVYEHPDFYIQVLFWLDGTTDIHQHEFSGAFHVLAGSSIHATYTFENVSPVNAFFRLGDLRLTRTELLELGSTVQITSGHGCIHSLFHLDTPSATVVVRTHSDPGTGPQFTYLPPHVALDPVRTDALTMRRKQLMDVLERIEDPGYPELMVALVRELDLERGFFLLQNGMTCLRHLGGWGVVWEAFTEKHGDAVAARIAPTLEEIVRRDGLVTMRSAVIEVEHRFFLALLLNLPDRDGILGMVAQRIPGDPLEAVQRWAEELIEVSDRGTWLLDAGFPEDSSIPEEDQPAVFLAVLRCLLEGKSAHGISAGVSGPEFETIRDVFLQSSWARLLPGDPR